MVHSQKAIAINNPKLDFIIGTRILFIRGGHNHEQPSNYSICGAWLNAGGSKGKFASTCVRAEANIHQLTRDAHLALQVSIKGKWNN